MSTPRNTRTSNNVEITAGLRVRIGCAVPFNGTVQASQFTNRRRTGPGGVEWDGLFWVELDNGQTAKYLGNEMFAL